MVFYKCEVSEVTESTVRVVAISGLFGHCARVVASAVWLDESQVLAGGSAWAGMFVDKFYWRLALSLSINTNQIGWGMLCVGRVRKLSARVYA